jgi:rhodanese-related sulfurtransferase
MTAKPKRYFAAVVFIIAAATLFLASAATADVLLYDGKPYLHVIHEGRSIKIQRIQDPGYELKGYFAKTARKCPPFCIQPIAVDPAVRTIGEIELFHFMENDLREGRGVLIDARTPSWHRKGTIPGSVNYPFTLFTQDENASERDAILREFGAKPRQQPGLLEKTMQELGLSDKRYLTDRWDFTEAKTLVIWCNGPACGQSPRAIEGLISAGYPADKIFYYRGGMQMWQLWGLTTVIPES